tara:strand:+ start:1704 stop:2357 length:654 start_codon:yes stop_codon:yes gene_type:complete
MNKHTATLRDGQKVTRNSKTRVYSHVAVMVCRETGEHHVLGWSSRLDLAEANAQRSLAPYRPWKGAKQEPAIASDAYVVAVSVDSTQKAVKVKGALGETINTPLGEVIAFGATVHVMTGGHMSEPVPLLLKVGTVVGWSRGGRSLHVAVDNDHWLYGCASTEELTWRRNMTVYDRSLSGWRCVYSGPGFLPKGDDYLSASGFVVEGTEAHRLAMEVV